MKTIMRASYGYPRQLKPYTIVGRVFTSTHRKMSSVFMDLSHASPHFVWIVKHLHTHTHRRAFYIKKSDVINYDIKCVSFNI